MKATSLESQEARVLRDLRENGKYGCCSEIWYMTGIPNNRNAICTLRKARHHIDSVICSDEHGPTYRRYIWRHGPHEACPICRPDTPPQQQELALGATP